MDKNFCQKVFTKSFWNNFWGNFTKFCKLTYNFVAFALKRTSPWNWAPWFTMQTLFVMPQTPFFDLLFLLSFFTPIKNCQNYDLCFVSQKFPDLPENFYGTLLFQSLIDILVYCVQRSPAGISGTFWPKKFSANMPFLMLNLVFKIMLEENKFRTTTRNGLKRRVKSMFEVGAQLGWRINYLTRALVIKFTGQFMFHKKIYRFNS